MTMTMHTTAATSSAAATAAAGTMALRLRLNQLGSPALVPLLPVNGAGGETLVLLTPFRLSFVPLFEGNVVGGGDGGGGYFVGGMPRELHTLAPLQAASESLILLHWACADCMILPYLLPSRAAVS
jgi:hypothetical protein